MDITEKLNSLEKRLLEIEKKLNIEVVAPTVEKVEVTQIPEKQQLIEQEESGTNSVTKILGIGGAVALILAVSYIIKLSIDAGLFTPVRQIGLSVLIGFFCIVVGIRNVKANKEYLSILPAAGIIILFLSVFGAFNLYHLIPNHVAFGAIILISALSLALCKFFATEIFAVFSVFGIYFAPVLVNSVVKDIGDYIVYFICSSLVFASFSIIVKKRSVYLLSLYLGLISFNLHFAYKAYLWREVICFQAFQFLVFVSAATYFSIKHKEPIDSKQVFPHFLPLALFYFIEFDLLKKYLPDLALALVCLSAIILYLAFYLARLMMKQELISSRNLISSYVALIVVHGIYFDYLSDAIKPWFAGLAIILVFLAESFLGKLQRSLGKPILVTFVILYIINTLRIVFSIDINSVPNIELLYLLFISQLYSAYFIFRRNKIFTDWNPCIVLAAHSILMVAFVETFSDRIIVSLAWGLSSICFLLLAFKNKDKLLAQSSLVIFAGTALKVLFYDLSSSTPLVRICSLLIVAFTFYLGGLIYQKINDFKEN